MTVEPPVHLFPLFQIQLYDQSLFTNYLFKNKMDKISICAMMHVLCFFNFAELFGISRVQLNQCQHSPMPKIEIRTFICYVLVPSCTKSNFQKTIFRNGKYMVIRQFKFP